MAISGLAVGRHKVIFTLASAINSQMTMKLTWGTLCHKLVVVLHNLGNGNVRSVVRGPFSVQPLPLKVPLTVHTVVTYT